MRILWPLVLLAAGCVRVETVYSESLPAEGVVDLFADSDRGDFTYDGSAEDGTDVFDVEARVWGRGSSGGRADRRAATNQWGAQVTDGLLDLWARSPEHRSGVDFTVVGPSDLNVDLVLLDGTAVISNVDGSHIVDANRILGNALSGDIDFYAVRDGIDVEIFADEGDEILLQAYGDVFVLLPYGLDYDLEIFADFEWGYEVQDLGFDDLFLAPDYVSAITGQGTTRVEIVASGGGVYLYEAIPPL